MQREERLRSMLELLRSEGFATVEELSRKFYISLPTAYRDLRELEREKLIIRSGGGAIPVMAEKAHLPLDFRQIMNVSAKVRIGQGAAAFLEPGSVVFLDASSTVASMVPFMDPKLDLTVLTNGLLTAVQLREVGIRTYCVGGRLVDNSVAVCGKLACDVIDQFAIQKLFFSAFGVDGRGVIVDMSETESSLRRYILNMPVTSVFLCDHSKFGRSSVFHTTPLEMVDYVVTDAPLPPESPRPRREVLVV